MAAGAQNSSEILTDKSQSFLQSLQLQLPGKGDATDL